MHSATAVGTGAGRGLAQGAQAVGATLVARRKANPGDHVTVCKNLEVGAMMGCAPIGAWLCGVSGV
jgi:hypothetical protein